MTQNTPTIYQRLEKLEGAAKTDEYRLRSEGH